MFDIEKINYIINYINIYIQYIKKNLVCFQLAPWWLGPTAVFELFPKDLCPLLTSKLYYKVAEEEGKGVPTNNIWEAWACERCYGATKAAQEHNSCPCDTHQWPDHNHPYLLTISNPNLPTEPRFMKLECDIYANMIE